MAARFHLSNSSLNANRDVVINSYSTQSVAGLDPLTYSLNILEDHAALGAMHDAAERPDPPRCHPETREAIQKQIDAWARDKSANAKPILWLTGAAGAGKSAIAQTMIERWRRKDLVAPNFFFWRSSPELNCKTRLIGTISLQVTTMIPQIKTRIAEAVGDGIIFKKTLKSQLDDLVISPLKALQVEEQSDPVSMIIVVDGLDECCSSLPKTRTFPGQHFEDQQKEILGILAYACQELPTLRVMVACRPEQQIRMSFAEETLATLTTTLSLIDEPNADADIRLYLMSNFARIRAQYPGIGSSWPGEQVISLLVEKSSGQFIYPSTVVKYLSHRRRFPVHSLQRILATQKKSRHAAEENPLSDLDALYILVFDSVSPEARHAITFILGFMCYDAGDNQEGFQDCVDKDLYGPRCSLQYFEHWLLLTAGELSIYLADLHSVLSIPPLVDPKNPFRVTKDGARARRHDAPIRFLHATMPEFLQNIDRSKEHYIGKEQYHLQRAINLVRHIGEYQRLHIIRNLAFDSLLDSINFVGISADLMICVWGLLKEDIGHDIPATVTDLGTDYMLCLIESRFLVSPNLIPQKEQLLTYLSVRVLPSSSESNSDHVVS